MSSSLFVINKPDQKTVYCTGDTITGRVIVTMPNSVPLTDVLFSFHCVGEVSLTGVEREATCGRKDFLEQTLPLTDDVKVEPSGTDFKVATIPFTFTFPKDKSLPSSHQDVSGSIKHFFRVQLGSDKSNKHFKKFAINLKVHSPIEANLNLGTAVEDRLYDVVSQVELYGRIDRRCFAPLDTVKVRVRVRNTTATAVQPRISLLQTQRYRYLDQHNYDVSHNKMVIGGGGFQQKDVYEVTGAQVAPHSDANYELSFRAPSAAESLSIRCSLITVEYFVLVKMDVPSASEDVCLKLPVVLTTAEAVAAVKKDAAVEKDAADGSDEAEQH